MEDFELSRKKSSDESWLLSYADLITNLLIFFVALFSAMEMSRVKMQQIQEALAGQSATYSLKELQGDLESHIEAQGYQEIVSANLTDRGVIIALNSGIVFPSGSAEIDDRFKAILGDVMAQVLPYSGKYDFAVEGHTDSTPIKAGSRYRSNWELGSARAHVVREHLEVVGIPRTKLHVEGYADTRPLQGLNGDSLSEKELKDRQRRVMIRIY
ncbi:OmpA/MotB family protein [Pseudobacteriovorax antillogorgiicola]|uniref:Chemotaxis protein MotB n=1 Tax=Pseudobacteriovorax antillogorgiicola TaxID=1513793 RepID=A0A1Y6CSS5_9BACT|nr:flagellar motor protein MotB [Pseudobacteriovorax antillogorgiicola]TCS45906.1 chemotaxis protein MotB [Pseudobacteriovorax antillogorgiicola]SMF71103.1 chemotaxis protein MotB [Pseudobacteriovorax antillogorgiicola]